MNKLPDIIPFSNILTKTRFEAQINLNQFNRLNSITFYYNMNIPLNIERAKNSADVNTDPIFKIFEDTILGKIYGGVFIEKYLSEVETKSYLVFDGRQYKIGKSNQPEKRLKELKVANPNCTLISSSKFIPEKYLHELFNDRRTKGEWFDLKNSDVDLIVSMMAIENQLSANSIMRMANRKVSANKQAKHITNEAVKTERSIDKALFKYGKYKGRLVSSMKTVDERKYLYWAYNNLGNLDAIIKTAIKKEIY